MPSRSHVFRLLLVAFSIAASIQPHEAMADDGFSWPPGQVLPHFPAPASTVELIDVSLFSADEQLAISALVGRVNRRKPRLALTQPRSEEGPLTWFATPTCNIKTSRLSRDQVWNLFARFRDDFDGVVTYDARRNAHVRNLAATAAAQLKAIPVAPGVLQTLQSRGIDLPICREIPTGGLASPIEVYQRLYEEYWPACEKRFLLSARPYGRNGDYHHTRDLAAACGAATVYLDCKDPEERALFELLVADMPVGNAVVLGWYTTERSGVTTASKYGVGTIPADHFMNATLFAGGNRKIVTPPVSDLPELEDRLYVAVFISDGDNVQYVQHAMRRLWDDSVVVRGTQPLNWTIAPGLVDLAPGLLNYYYSTATPNDCFVSGPSGMGYLMPVNTLRADDAPFGTILDNRGRIAAYAELTQRYLKRAHLSVVTVWDNLSPLHREVFALRAPELAGVTVQNFRDAPNVVASVEKNDLIVEKLVQPYVSTRRAFVESLAHQRRQWNQQGPGFAALQVNVWKLSPKRALREMNEFAARYPDVQFVRADHYFELKRRAAVGVAVEQGP